LGTGKGELFPGMLFLAVGAAVLTVTMVPRWRGTMRWRDGSRFGTVSGLGFGASFVAAGSLLSWREVMPELLRGGCLAAFLLGFLAAFAGNWLDGRARRSQDQETGR
jgi:hypothetical protein